MFGFKIEVPNREGSLKDKTRPIYLDMQGRKTAEAAGAISCRFVPRLRHPWIQESLMPCSLILPINMAIPIVEHMRTVGKRKKLWMRLVEYVCFYSNVRYIADMTHTECRRFDWC